MGGIFIGLSSIGEGRLWWVAVMVVIFRSVFLKKGGGSWERTGCPPCETTLSLPS